MMMLSRRWFCVVGMLTVASGLEMIMVEGAAVEEEVNHSLGEQQSSEKQDRDTITSLQHDNLLQPPSADWMLLEKSDHDYDEFTTMNEDDAATMTSYSSSSSNGRLLRIQDKNDKACAAQTNCSACTSHSYGCHWCAKDHACHARGSMYGCVWGMSCSKEDDNGGHDDDNNNNDDNNNDTSKNTTNGCASHTNCTDCTLSSHLCHWCAHDNACHAVGSVYGCLTGVDCFSNDRCRRVEPEAIVEQDAPEAVQMKTLPLVVILVTASLLACCATCCFCCANGLKGAYDDLAPFADEDQIIQDHIHDDDYGNVNDYADDDDDNNDNNNNNNIQQGNMTSAEWVQQLFKALRQRGSGAAAPPPMQSTTAQKSAAEGKVKKKKSAKKLAAEQRKAAEQALMMRSEIQRQCYLLLLGDRYSQDVRCDLERTWKTDTESCKMYLDLIHNARLGQHQPSEYLPRDAAILQRYEKMQELTGQIDFDKMLQLFVKLLRDNDWIAAQFRELYNYVIVDEYQDNSEVQSKLLLEIVTDGRVTVVGDDDQCIYEFRGASPGNFDTFSKHFSTNAEDPVIPTVREAVLEENYRSTGNILNVGAAFLEGCSRKRGHKTLRPTKESGEKVELWSCPLAEDQAWRIAKAIKKRHDEQGVSWGQVACLFRCFHMGPQEPLHYALQRQLAKLKVPCRVIGGKSLLAGPEVSDVIAYLSLSLTGTPDRMNDDAFSRVLNKPPRRIGPKMLELIKAHRSVMVQEEKRPVVGLEEAALNLMEEDKILSETQKAALKAFFDLLNKLRATALGATLPDLLMFVWQNTGLSEWYKKMAGKRAEKKKSQSMESSEDETDDGEKHDHEGPGGGAPRPLPPPMVGLRIREQSSRFPVGVQTLFTLAEAHLEGWKDRDKQRKADACSGDETVSIKSLVDLATECLIRRAMEIPRDRLPQQHLMQHDLDELYMPGGVGLPVVNSFLSDLTLQSKDAEGDDKPGDDGDKVTLCTVHRAKGLEWKEVYVPFFNEGYMPTKFREEDSKASPVPHQTTCRAWDTNDNKCCNKQCTRHYAEEMARHLGLTPEERQSDEERRLAHVAATRAKDRLVFVSVGKCEESSFAPYLARLDSNILEMEARPDGSMNGWSPLFL